MNMNLNLFCQGFSSWINFSSLACRRPQYALFYVQKAPPCPDDALTPLAYGNRTDLITLEMIQL